jgi:hypothetical protein
LGGTGFCAAIEIGEYADIIKAGNAHTTGFFIVIAGSGVHEPLDGPRSYYTPRPGEWVLRIGRRCRAPCQERDN